jgi:hypothetical protein
MRRRTDLAGRWRFWPDIDGKLASDSAHRNYVSPGQLDDLLGPARSINVPGPWQAQFADLSLWWGTAWYERTFDADPEWRERRVRICFHAVDYFCNVWMNGHHVGSHEGGYLPFDFDIDDQLRWNGDNSVMVEVRDPGRERSEGSAAPFTFDEVPHGKQSWYGPVGGLWLGAFIEAGAPSFIRSAKVAADVSGSVRIDARVDSRRPVHGMLTCDVVDDAGTLAGRTRTQVDSEGHTRVELEIVGPRLWDTERPNLYEARLALDTGDTADDAWSDKFGFRKISTDAGRILLNDRPIILRGALDQDYYPDLIYTPPSERYIERQMVMAKEMGLNLLRCHIKVPDPRYFSAADRLGLLVWAELPNWIDLTEAAKERARETFEGMVERDFNHPSIAIWTVVNESWGVELSKADHRRWVADTYKWAKALDPTRLVVDNSACQGNWHMSSDLNDFHFYRALPDHAHEWDQLTAGWVAQPHVTHSPHGDASMSGEEPLVVSEFGNWGLPDIDELLTTERREPWWFDTGAEWGDGSVLPRGALDRFSEWKLDDVFGSWEGLATASQEIQFESLRHEILDLRSHPEMAGYVITELTDVHWECNGLLDFGRNPKSHIDRLHQINALDVLAMRPSAGRYWSGDTVHLAGIISHYSDGDLHDCVLECEGAGIDTVSVMSNGVAECSVAPLPPISLSLPHVAEPQLIGIVARLRSGAREIASTRLNFAVWPSFSSDRRNGPVKVLDSIDDATTTFVRDGGRVVLVATEEEALARLHGIAARTRRGTVWEGDWAQGLHWLRPRLLNGSTLPPVLSSLWTGLIPDLVLTGYLPAHALDVLTGYFVGWLHHTVATTAAFQLGRGCGIATTFPVLEPYGRDPLATWFLDRLIATARDAGLQPQMRL